MLNTRLQTTQAQYKYTRLETAGPKPNQSVGSYIKEQTQPMTIGKCSMDTEVDG